MENGKIKYICTGYKKGKCQNKRIAISEEDLEFMVRMHYRNYISDYKANNMAEIIKEIIVGGIDHIEIFYLDGTTSKVLPTGQIIF